jgi:hypothetical protein
LEEHPVPTIDDQLRYFAEDVGLAVALEMGGKISPQEAFRRIKRRYRNLKGLIRELDDGKNPISPET